MSDYPMLISNKLHSFRNFKPQNYKNPLKKLHPFCKFSLSACLQLFKQTYKFK